MSVRVRPDNLRLGAEYIFLPLTKLDFWAKINQIEFSKFFNKRINNDKARPCQNFVERRKAP